MNKCRRIIAILLSLAVVTSFFVFSASADSSDTVPVIVKYYLRNSDGTWGTTVQRSELTNGFIKNIGFYGFQIIGFEVRPNSYNGLDHFTVNFKIGAYRSNPAAV